ncbi:hypothetical protein [Pseudomonas sp. RC2C2]|uniref:hypothetical protein n=1 Tax=Pseudomonas sp. RC2C2 TaxID=2834408 RepID=UPI001BD0A521|nr:hypothetical protein [Pseudomonas sp. RC2C2]MBS7596730.1 hypothetical protein [Pseudomonas sp. RC2C2]
MLRASQVNIGLIFALLIFFVFAGQANASCRVDDMVRLYKQGSGKAAIGEACEDEVDDAPKCDFDKVVSKVFKKQSAWSIVDDCKECENPKCFTQVGECDMVQMKKNAKEGDSCGCFTPGGVIPGDLVCD